MTYSALPCALVALLAHFCPAHADMGRAGRPKLLSEAETFQAISTATPYPEIRTTADAESFLTEYLPLATVGNPKYRSKGSDDLTNWITKSVTFRADPKTNSISYEASEFAFVFRNGVKVGENAHHVTFVVQDVDILDYSYDTDLTEQGERAVGILFKCASGDCVHSIWNGQSYSEAQSDFYVQDSILRSEILEAFRILKNAPRTL